MELEILLGCVTYCANWKALSLFNESKIKSGTLVKKFFLVLCNAVSPPLQYFVHFDTSILVCLYISEDD